MWFLFEKQTIIKTLPILCVLKWHKNVCTYLILYVPRYLFKNFKNQNSYRLIIKVNWQRVSIGKY